MRSESNLEIVNDDGTVTRKSDGRTRSYEKYIELTTGEPAPPLPRRLRMRWLVRRWSIRLVYFGLGVGAGFIAHR